MNDSLEVSLVDGAGECLDQPRPLIHRLGGSADLLGQCATVDVLEHQAGQAVVLRDLEDLDHVGVLHPRDGLGLVAKPVE